MPKLFGLMAATALLLSEDAHDEFPSLIGEEDLSDYDRELADLGLTDLEADIKEETLFE